MTLPGAPARLPGYSYLQLVLYQVSWWCSVLGAAHGRSWLGPLVVSGLVVVHLACMHAPGRELLLLAGATLVGLVGDACLLGSGALAIAHDSLPGRIAPPAWLLGLWPAFAGSLRLALSWLQGRWLLALILGAIAGPLAYLAGIHLGALSAPRGLSVFLLAVALEWGLALPLLAGCAQMVGRRGVPPVVAHAA